MSQVNEINTPKNCLCSECHLKLGAFHEFYHMVKITHGHRFKSENEKLTIQSTPDSHKANACNGENGVKLKKRRSLRNRAITLHTAQCVTVEKKTLKLNSNSNQFKEINLQIEKDGKNVRCNILNPAELVDEMDQATTLSVEETVRQQTTQSNVETDENSHTDEESETELETEQIHVSNYPVQQIKMEEELLINDDDDNYDSMNEDDASIHNNAEDNQQSDKNHPSDDNNSLTCNICHKRIEKSWFNEHQARSHNVCRKCRRIFPNYSEMSIYQLRCRKHYCRSCKKKFTTFDKKHFYYCKKCNYNRQKNVQLIRQAENEKILKEWASQILQT